MKSYVVYKPYGMLSQFTREVDSHITLADLDFDFPKDVYPLGRLDKDSEGLLLLTNDKSLNYKYLNPSKKTLKTYYVQVEGQPSQSDLRPMIAGMEISVKKQTYHTKPAKATIIATPLLPPRNPPVRFRKTVVDTWLSISLIEGKNRQVRKMCAGIGFPVLRLVRVAIANMHLGEYPIASLGVGEVKEIDLSKMIA